MAVNKIILDDINKIDNLSILSNTKLLEVLNTVIKNEKNLYAQLIEIVDFLNKTYFGESNSDNFITRPINGKVSSVSITNGKLIVSYYYEGAIHNIIYIYALTYSGCDYSYISKLKFVSVIIDNSCNGHHRFHIIVNHTLIIRILIHKVIIELYNGVSKYSKTTSKTFYIKLIFNKSNLFN